MLLDLQIQDLGVIKRAHLPFSPAFTVLTGETGAGKTMVLNALGLLMGSKTDPRLIRSGASQLAIEGSWDIAGWPLAAELVSGVGGEIDEDGTVISTRLVTAGRSKAVLGGRAVPQGTLSEFTASLVAVHGQADQQRLRTPSRQRAALDAYGTAAISSPEPGLSKGSVRVPSRTRTTNAQRGAAATSSPAERLGGGYGEVLSRYQELWERRSELAAKFEQLTSAAAERSREAELLGLSLAEVEKVAPIVGEHAELTASAARLSNSESLRAAVAGAYNAIAGEGADSDSTFENASALVETARRELASAAAVDTTLEPFAERAAEIGYLQADLASELAGYLDSIGADPGQLEQVQARLGELNSLARTLRMAPDEIVAWAETAAAHRLELENDSDTIALIETQLESVNAEIAKAAQDLTSARTGAARELAASVTKELAGLGMKEAELRIAITPTELGPSGQDQVEFLLVPHSSAAPSPLSKGASGGELSRVMLALELTLATAGRKAAGGATAQARQPSRDTVTGESPRTEVVAPPLVTFVFDEIDAGVGGKAALEVGSRLARLAQQTQVIVVTHLPQVAAFADQHLVVHKDGGETTVTPVNGSDREKEIARMLAGTDTSETALKHAQELIASAHV